MRAGQFIQLVYLLKKKVMNSPCPLEVSLKKTEKRANIAKDGKKWLAFVNSGFL